MCIFPDTGRWMLDTGEDYVRREAGRKAEGERVRRAESRIPRKTEEEKLKAEGRGTK